jgi:membrane protease YdiL (CAAX protease family)
MNCTSKYSQQHQPRIALRKGEFQMNLKTIVERHPVLSYFILVYLLTWGAVLLIVQTLASSGEMDPMARTALVSLPMLIAPGIAGITLTALIEGQTGLRVMWSRMTLWQADFRWYAIALGLLPILLLVILSILAFFVSPNFAPGLSLFGLAGIAAGYLEEVGWTGFAVPRLLSRWSPLAVGLVVGLLWGLWHGLADYLIRGDTLGAFWPITFCLFVLPLTAWRILMVWVYDNTYSGPLAQLMHFSYTGSLALFVPLAAISHVEDALIYAVLMVALWILVALVAISQQKESQVYG